MPSPAVRLNLRELRRLPGRTATLQRLLVSHRLWLAPDFLLQLKTLPYSQEAQRFSYRDIQALQICRSSRGTAYNFVLVLMLFFLVAVTIMVHASSLWGIGLAAGFLLLLLIVNIARGPTCRCVLQTALGEQTLPSLCRQRPAQRAVALITERVMAAQADKRGYE